MGNKIGKVVVWVLLALLIVGLAGFGIGSFGGSATTVARVGGHEITAQEYFRALEQELRATQMAEGRALTRAEAEARGIPQAVQSRLIVAAALDAETDRLGLSAGDERVAQALLQEENFRALDGSFDRDSYEATLRRMGWSVPEFEAEVRADLARSLLRASVVAGMPGPEALAEVLAAFLAERRDIAWVRFGPNALSEPVGNPTQAQLEAFHEADPDAYALPRTKRLTYLLLRPEDMAATLDPDPDAVAALYEERRDDYVQPARRLAERLVFPDAQAAREARAALDAGETTFPELVKDRGLTLGDVDLGEVTRDDLGDAAGEVFALEEPGVVGPVETDLGPALIRVNAILEAREIPLADVENELAREVSLERARRELEAMVIDLDDRLAAGATLEDLAAETAAELGTLDFTAGMQEGVAAYDELREAAEALTEDDFPRIETLDDGGLFALRLDEVIPPRTPPLEEVRAEVAADLRAAERRAALVALAEEAAAALRPGDDLGAVADAVQRAEGITRDGFVEGVPEDFLSRAFALEDAWETTVVEAAEAAYLVQVEDIRPVRDDDPRAAALRQGVLQEAGQSRASDVLNLYGQALLARSGIEIEQSAINAVHSQAFN